MKTNLTDIDRAWLAGVLSTQGSFKNGQILRAKKAGRRVSARWELATAKLSLVNRIASLLEVEPTEKIRNGHVVKVISFWGDDLHKLMELVWPWLLSYRKQQYARVKKASDESQIHPDEY